jgi:D-3-phosphoglycerate dehydrogenase
MQREIVVTDTVYDDIETEREIVEASGAAIRLLDASAPEQVIEDAADAAALLTTRTPITGEVLAALSGLRAVVRYGSGYDNVDVDAATERGVVVVNVPDFCVGEVATHALALLLACERRIAQYDRLVRDGVWDWSARTDLDRLRGKTLGIVGFGRVGTRLAEMVRGFELDVVAYSRRTGQETMREYGVEEVTFDELLARADLVSIHTALNDDTYRLFDAAAFETMRETAVLCNTSRGDIVDQDALLAALDDGEIAVAGLDVLAEEPPADDDPLVTHDDVVVTPHVAWYSQRAKQQLQRRVAEEALAVLRGETPEHAVNPEVLE